MSPTPLASWRLDAAGTELAGFLGLLESRIDSARARLRDGLVEALHGSSDLCFDVDTLLSSLWSPMPWSLVRVCSRALVLEMHVANIRSLLGTGTPDERFAAYLDLLRDPEFAEAVLTEYPVLAHIVDQALTQWVTSSLMFVADVCTDAAHLDRCFADGDGSMHTLVGVEPGMGDLHRGGRSVVFATFATGQRLVYKPRSLAADVHVHQLFAWLDERGDHPRFRRVRVLDRGDHGWVEWIETRRDGSADGAAKYYRRVGGLLAVAYILNAIDLHFENIVASGDQPVLVDLETLFHPMLVELDMGRADERAIGLMAVSVMGPGLLPQRIYGGAVDAGMDVSGIGAAGPQQTPFEVPSWAGSMTSEMRMTRVHGTFRGGDARPLVDSVPTEPVRFVDHLVGGFESIYRLCIRHRDELLAKDGPIDAFASDEIRILLRPTRSYARLLDESTHPDVLRDSADRDALFDSLRLSIPLCPVLARTIEVERQDLWRGDIPIFTTTPSSTDLVTSTGEVIAEALSEAGAVSVERRIRSLDEADLARQRWLIQASLSTSATKAAPTRPLRAPAAPQPAAAATRAVERDELIDVARSIGDRLLATAICGRDDATWLGLTSLGDGTGGRLGPAGDDLYDGLTGIALFLAHLGQSTGRAEFSGLARRAITSVLRSQRDRRLDGLGAFTGAGGLIYAYTHLGVLWDDAGLIEAAHRVCDRVPAATPFDRAFDLTSGAAGSIVAMASLWHIDPRPSIVRAVTACAEHLLASSAIGAQGRQWPSPIPGGQPLSGLSHGAAGIALALQIAAGITGDRDHRVVATEALRFERTLFVPEQGNWEDRRFVRAGDEGQVCRTTWCHGAPGIGLARLREVSLFTGADFGQRAIEQFAAADRAEIHTAVATTLREGPVGSHCLCHGSLGNLELILQAATAFALADPGSSDGRQASRYHDELARWTAVLVDDIRLNGPLCATDLGIETPGLMTGLAGIGLQLLRLADPQGVPSVLTLETPTQSARRP